MMGQESLNHKLSSRTQNKSHCELPIRFAISGGEPAARAAHPERLAIAHAGTACRVNLRLGLRSLIRAGPAFGTDSVN